MVHSTYLIMLDNIKYYIKIQCSNECAEKKKFDKYE